MSVVQVSVMCLLLIVMGSISSSSFVLTPFFDAYFFVSLLGVADLGSQDKVDYPLISFFLFSPCV